jgi:hypothetical protein
MGRLIAPGAVIVGLTLLTTAGCGTGGHATTTTATFAGSGHLTKAQAKARIRAARRRHRRLRLSLTKVPAQMIPHRVVASLLQGDVLSPATNGWKASDRQQSTEVYAGADPYQPNVGRFLVVRAEAPPAHRSDRVDVPGAGAVTITRAPLGSGVVTSAQQNGQIEFTSSNGVSGTLHLSDDTVTINR